MFCPRCKTELKKDDEGHLVCPDCGYTFYRNPRPTTSVVIKEENRVLLARRGIEPKKGKWDLLGGFLEYDETPQKCAKREVKEETGLKIEIEQFLGFYPDRYFDSGNQIELSVLTIGYKAALINNNPSLKPQDDVEKLKWFDLNALPDDLAFKNARYFLGKIKKIGGGKNVKTS